MKKILSVILSALIILSVFSVGAFAVEAEQTRFQKWMSIHESDTELAFKINTRVGNYLVAFMSCTAYVKDGQLAVTAVFDGTEIKMISKDDDLCIFPAKFPFVHYKMKSEDLFGSDDMGFSGYSFDGERELVLEEKTIIIEDYTFMSDGEEYQVSAYFEGDVLKRITFGQNIADMDVEIEFEILSYEVDDDVFKMPSFSIDVTFLVDILLKLGIL